LCRSYGAALAVSEMIGAQPQLVGTLKTQRRMNHEGEVAPISVQIAGAEPSMLADAARVNAARGADIIDINMGCPAKKVCNVMAGSALLQNEKLVGKILDTVVKAVDIPVTLKIRTGWDKQHKNALSIAHIAENSGIQALAIHGRTRACAYLGEAEYDTIAAVKAVRKIPIIANGDITTPEKAQHILAYTQADAIMIGRAAQGRPWIFREIDHYLATGQHLPAPEVTEIHQVLINHLHDIYEFYGEYSGVRIARKHISWYTKGLVGSASFRHAMNQLQSSEQQVIETNNFFSRLAEENQRLSYINNGEALVHECNEGK
ncbi:MAG: tRNA dihydrouridine synthase DusB, partial [Nitrosomonas sp.]